MTSDSEGYYNNIISRRAVLYTEQTLTDEQKAQARKNIGAIGANDIYAESIQINTPSGVTDVQTAVNRNDLFGENAHKSTSIHPQISVRNLVNSLGEDATIFVRNENRFNEIAGLLSDNPPTLLATIKSVEAMVTHDNIKSQAEISDKKLSIRQDTEYLSVAEKYRDGTASEEETEQLRKMVDEEAKKAGYTSDTDWRMDHKAPNAKYDVPIYQVDTLYGGDGSIYSNRAAYYYGDGRSYDQKAIRVLQKVRNNPNADITVYRAVPTNRVESHVRNGDWVTTVEEYAKEHLYIQYGGMSEQRAADRVKELSFSRKNPDYDWSVPTIDLYYENVQPAGISMQVFDNFITTYNRTEPDYDGNGNAVRNSKMYKVAEYIESLDIPKEQKEVLFLCEYSQKSLKKVRFT